MKYPATEKLEIIRLVEEIASAGAPHAGQAWRIQERLLSLV